MKNKNNAGLPNEIYFSFVESLYANRWVMYFGVFSQMLVAFTIAQESGREMAYNFCWAFLAVGFIRYLDYAAYDKVKGTESFRAKPANLGKPLFRRRHIRGVSNRVVGAFQHWCPDSFAEFASMTLAMAAMVTVVGKNFASKRLVLLISSAVFTPIFFALLQTGGWANIAGAVLLIPFSASVISLSGGLRDFLGQAVRDKLDAKAFADKLDVALNNMPQGLIMFDSENRAMVVNKRAVEMLKAPSGESLNGRSLKTILRFCRFNGLLGNSMSATIEQRLCAMLDGTDTRKFTLKSRDGGTVEFSGKKAGSNGGVLMFENVTERVQAEEKIHRMARFDSLSGLPNRSFFKELSRTYLAKAAPDLFIAFFVIDIDDFKHVNDSLGHPVGDELLCRFADRINLLAAETACFSRFGGDEFVGLLTGFDTQAEAEMAARRTLASLIGNYDVGGHHLTVTISAGIVITRSQSFDHAQTMIKADLALYESKGRGKGISTLFADAMDERYQRRQRLKTDLKKAIRDRKLNVFYQPIIDAATMQIATCEALCRWDHPELGPISPAIFIPLAEETGTITDLTRFMLEQACEDCKGWEGNVSVAVNLSALDFRGSQIGEMVRVALARSRLAPSRLEVEVTEGAILEDQHVASTMLAELKKSGIRIALDDFGTGYSSLSYLHNLPLDKVKIDQSFVREIVNNDRSLKLVSGVTQLAHELGLVVTVEGIETLEQFERLKEHAHIDLAQGFLFGAALSSRGISTLISSVFSIGQAESPKARVA